MLKLAYESAWQHPGVTFIAGAPLLALAWLLIARGGPRRRVAGYLLLVLELEIMLDAWLTGARSPVGASDVACATFIVLGDLRFFYLVERQRTASRAASFWLALGVSLVLPIGSGTLQLLWPARMHDSALFFLYELAALPLVIAFCRWRRPREVGVRDGRVRYVQCLLLFELVQYATWAAADALIVLGYEAGWGLRIVANAIYHVGFAPVAALGLPAEGRT